MARQVKATAKPKKGKNDLSQSERFIETARALEVDETGETFNAVFKKLVPPKPRPTIPKRRARTK
jgi:hypothetical protein